jgi:hypothetical protein
MTLPLTPEMVESAYDFLRGTPPFKRWKLPVPDDVVFHVTGARSHMAAYAPDGKKGHQIYVSAKMVGHTDTLLKAVAHEMAHMRQQVMGDRSLAHNANFFRLTARIAKYHGFDPKEL